MQLSLIFRSVQLTFARRVMYTFCCHLPVIYFCFNLWGLVLLKKTNEKLCMSHTQTVSLALLTHALHMRNVDMHNYAEFDKKYTTCFLSYEQFH